MALRLRQTWLADKSLTGQLSSLEEHSQNKHNKSLAECFPTFQVQAAK